MIPGIFKSITKLPASWSWKKLGDICEFKYGKSLPTGKREHGEFPVFGSNGVVGFHKAYLIKGPAIIIGRKGSIGKINLSKENCFPIDTTYFADFDAQYIDIYWLSELLKILPFFEMNKAAAVPGLNREDAYKLKIPLPPKETQKLIVELLDKAQALIDKRKEQIARMDQLIQSLFYDMFGDPVTNPKAWDIKKLGKISCKITDGTHKTPTYTDKGVVFLSAKNIKNNYLSLAEVKYISYIEHLELIKRCNPCYGDILITKSGSTGSAALVDVELEFSLFESLALVKYNRKILNGLFLKYFLNSLAATHQYAKFSKGGTIKHLHLNELRKLTLTVPPIDIQTTFADRVQKIEVQKEAMTTSLKELENNFNSLMQRAFKGELV